MTYNVLSRTLSLYTITTIIVIRILIIVIAFLSCSEVINLAKA